MATLVVAGLDDLIAVTALCKAMGTAYDVSGAAHLPDGIAAELPDTSFATGVAPLLLIRLEGFAPSVDLPRREAHSRRLGGLGPVTVLAADASTATWRAIRRRRDLRSAPTHHAGLARERSAA